MLRLELLPAGPGDCLWLEYGQPGKTHIILIDGGVKDTFGPLERRIGQALDERKTDRLRIDLMVCTHIDNDHIDGLLKLLKETQHQIEFGDIWFNGTRQLKSLPEPTPEEKRGDLLGGGEDFPRPDLLGLKEGDELSDLLITRNLPWNKAFGGKAAMVPFQGKLLKKSYRTRLKLTVLGPPVQRLRKLAEKWKLVKDGEHEMRDDLLGRSDTWPPVWRDAFNPDTSVNNGSSIVLLAEYGDQKLLLTGDAYGTDIEAGLARLQAERNLDGQPFPLTALKLPHHGSARNLSPGLVGKVQCEQYLISTDGSGNPMHPDQQALLRVLKYSTRKPCLEFNYEGRTTRPWRDRRNEVLALGLGAYDTDYGNQGLAISFG